MKGSGKLRVFVALGLLGQVALHLLFGRETFLYSMHYLPLLIVMASLVVFTRARVMALIVAIAIIVLGGFNNFQQLGKATEFIKGEVTQAHMVQLAIRERPSDPWPRGTQRLKSNQIGRIVPDTPERPHKAGHILLGWPGSQIDEKAYFESGGNFSPAVGSFGVSIWLTGRQGNTEATSDNIPLHLLRQEFIWDHMSEIPSILAESAYYRALWSSKKPGAWVLKLRAGANAATEVVIRSVGPAGGPIHLLEWDDRQLVINSRWGVTLNPMPAAVQLGEEGKKGWTTAHSASKRWSGESGWGYAKFQVKGEQDYEMVITDLNHVSVSEKKLIEPLSALRVDLPDGRFATSMQAQISHLLMGIVHDGARPGDPMSYPFPWLRDEAYVIVALARSGQLAIAKELSKALAENDFFGGFGAEADSPGLAIWSLTQVAKQLSDPQYDRWLWPHIRRKAKLITGMLSTDTPIHKQVSTPVIPLYTKPLRSADPDVTLVADPPRNGLIMGRINNSRAPLYVTAMSYRGLIDAAALADRVGQQGSAREWRRWAVELNGAWTATVDQRQQLEPLAYARGLWPTSAAHSDSPGFLQGLEDQWRNYRNHDFWQYTRHNVFRIAEAHQWLLLGRGDRAWTTLAAFWDHQDMPGLYSWRIESSPENTYNPWKRVRGWLEGQDSVMPSYSTAAELLLMQLDMLAYADETAGEPTIVIGAGVQPSWLEREMRAEGISTPNGRVDWIWNGRQMMVKIHGGYAHVRLGRGFTPGTPLKVEYPKPLLEVNRGLQQSLDAEK
jgi:hypothetical protein